MPVICSFLLCLCALMAAVNGQDQFDVLKITNVDFPFATGFAATFNATYDQEIAEFTVCYRFLITSYNDGWMWTFYSPKLGTWEWDQKGYHETFGYGTGLESEGYQSVWFTLFRNIPGGGLGDKAMPVYHAPLLPRFLQTGKWYNSCTSYSSKLRKLHLYQDGLKAHSYQYNDQEENPLRPTFFEVVKLGQNMRGLMTDVNIYSTFFEEEEMVSWTTGCQQRDGEIYKWDVSKLNITQDEDSTVNVEFIRLDKASVCPEKNVVVTQQEPSKLGTKSEQKRFKPKLQGNSSFIGKVLEVITDPDNKNAMDCKDRCYRLSGQILTIPENEEEEKLLDKTGWNYMMKKANNNITFLHENRKLTDFFVGGESKLSDLEKIMPNMNADIENRVGIYPLDGHFKVYHPVTGKELKPTKALIPYTNIELVPRKQCFICFTSLKDPIPNHIFFSRNGTLCAYNTCPGKRGTNFICTFPKQPLFNLRGLCKEAVMDTQYKFADHKPMNLSSNTGFYSWGKDNTRSYVGPKGWVIVRDADDKKWRMSHPSYPDQTLTMLDNDALPVGRHNWRIARDACSGGETVDKVLLLSGCHESEFTCDDGKCLDMSQRCNNIEVEMGSINGLHGLFAICRTVMM